ncbi:hypothetical protein RhiJN_12626 [Ceratobasidium sp. AG-Ba]|nr:hypothetical protein RhiJN_12626 [Ceratobasidium sp. AG-Ba]
MGTLKSASTSKTNTKANTSEGTSKASTSKADDTSKTNTSKKGANKDMNPGYRTCCQTIEWASFAARESMINWANMLQLEALHNQTRIAEHLAKLKVAKARADILDQEICLKELESAHLEQLPS